MTSRARIELHERAWPARRRRASTVAWCTTKARGRTCGFSQTPSCGSHAGSCTRVRLVRPACGRKRSTQCGAGARMPMYQRTFKQIHERRVEALEIAGREILLQLGERIGLAVVEGVEQVRVAPDGERLVAARALDAVGHAEVVQAERAAPVGDEAVAIVPGGCCAKQPVDGGEALGAGRPVARLRLHAAAAVDTRSTSETSASAERRAGARTTPPRSERRRARRRRRRRARSGRRRGARPRTAGAEPPVAQRAAPPCAAPATTKASATTDHRRRGACRRASTARRCPSAARIGSANRSITSARVGQRSAP